MELPETYDVIGDPKPRATEIALDIVILAKDYESAGLRLLAERLRAIASRMRRIR
jgi:hypothetical protein